MDQNETYAALAALRERCRELQDENRGLKADLVIAGNRLGDAHAQHSRLELSVQEKQARIDQLMAEKKRFADWVTGD